MLIRHFGIGVREYLGEGLFSGGWLFEHGHLFKEIQYFTKDKAGNILKT